MCILISKLCLFFDLYYVYPGFILCVSVINILCICDLPYGQFKISFNDISQPKIIKNEKALISISISSQGILGSFLIKKSLLSFFLFNNILLLLLINY